MDNFVFIVVVTLLFTLCTKPSESFVLMNKTAVGKAGQSNVSKCPQLISCNYICSRSKITFSKKRCDCPCNSYGNKNPHLPV
ncbi:unnamed protein product [Tenebrio molitor]|nr:unnamed protein product [Tenebrio molitor]